MSVARTTGRLVFSVFDRQGNNIVRIDGDVIAADVAYRAMVTLAALPPDDKHPYGHHKAEYFSAGFEGILILVAALGIIWALGIEGVAIGLGVLVTWLLLWSAVGLALVISVYRHYRTTNVDQLDQLTCCTF